MTFDAIHLRITQGFMVLAQIFIGIPLTIIELYVASPYLIAAARLESHLDNKSFLITYLKMFRRLFTGSDKPVSLTKETLLALMAFLTSPLGMILNLCVLVLMVTNASTSV